MWGGRRPARSTAMAVGLICIVSVGYAVYAVLVLRDAGDAGPVASRDAVVLGISGREEGVARVIVAIVILAVSALTVSLAVGVLRRRQGARHAALVTFGVLGLVAFAASLPGLAADPPRPGAPIGLATAIVDVAVVVLLLLPMTADDVEDAERDRERMALRR